MSKNQYPKINNTVIKNLLKQAKKSGIKVKQIDKDTPYSILYMCQSCRIVNESSHIKKKTYFVSGHFIPIIIY